MELAQAGDVDRAEEQRAVEDVVAREVLAVGERKHERDDRGLEQGSADLGKSRPSGAIRVEVDPGEHQHGDQIGERDPMARLLPDDREREVVPLERELDRQRGNQRTGDADEIEDQEREDAGDASQRLELQQEREDGGTLAPDVALGHRRADWPRVVGSVGTSARSLLVVDRHLKRVRFISLPLPRRNGILTPKLRSIWAFAPATARDSGAFSATGAD